MKSHDSSDILSNYVICKIENGGQPANLVGVKFRTLFGISAP